MIIIQVNMSHVGFACQKNERGGNMSDNNTLTESLISIASETFRLKTVFGKAVSKLDLTEQTKYQSQFAWFTKKVEAALKNADLKLINLEGQIYDPGMAVTPLNIEDFEPEDCLKIEQMIEPIIMMNEKVIKTGTVILGREN